MDSKIDLSKLELLYSQFLNIFGYLYKPIGQAFEVDYEIKESILILVQNNLIIKVSNKKEDNESSIVTSFKITDIDPNTNSETIIATNFDELYNYIVSNFTNINQIIQTMKIVLTQMTSVLATKYLEESVRQVIDVNFIQKIWDEFESIKELISGSQKNEKKALFKQLSEKGILSEGGSKDFNPFLEGTNYLNFSNNEGFINCYAFKIILLNSNKEKDVDYGYYNPKESKRFNECMKSNPKKQMINSIIEKIKNMGKFDKIISISRVLIKPNQLLRIVLNDQFYFDISVADKNYIRIYNNLIEKSIVDIDTYLDFKVKDIIPIYSNISNENQFNLDFEITNDPIDDQESYAFIVEKKHGDTLNNNDINEILNLHNRFLENKQFKYMFPGMDELTGNDRGIIFWFKNVNDNQEMYDIIHKLGEITSCEENWVYLISADNIKYNNDAYTIDYDYNNEQLFIRDKIIISYGIGNKFAIVSSISKMPIYIDCEIPAINYLSKEFEQLLTKAYEQAIMTKSDKLNSPQGIFYKMEILDNIIITDPSEHFSDIIIENAKPLELVGFSSLFPTDTTANIEISKQKALGDYLKIVKRKFLLFYEMGKISSYAIQFNGIEVELENDHSSFIADKIMLYNKVTDMFEKATILPRNKDIIKSISKVLLISPFYPLPKEDFSGKLQEELA